MRNFALAIIFGLFGSTLCYAQIANPSFIINTWEVLKYEEESGKQYSPPPEMQHDYLKFNADNTYESLEYNRITIKGTWELNVNSSMLVMRQTMLDNYPKELNMKILKLTATELVIEGEDAGGNKLIIYNEVIR